MNTELGKIEETIKKMTEKQKTNKTTIKKNNEKK
jgi:hypothetical protein